MRRVWRWYCSLFTPHVSTPHETQKVISTLNWIAENHPGYAPPRLWDDEEVANDYAAEAGEVGKVQR